MAIKNLVITESAYQIEMDKDETGAMLSCPRCGHVQERKPRTVCASCKRFIPSGVSKQRWKVEKKATYTNMEQYLPPTDEEETEVKFVKSRKSPSHLVIVRNFAIVGALCAGVYFGLPTALKSLMGEAAYVKMDKNMHQSMAKLIKPGQVKNLASAPKKK